MSVCVPPQEAQQHIPTGKTYLLAYLLQVGEVISSIRRNTFCSLADTWTLIWLVNLSGCFSILNSKITTPMASQRICVGLRANGWAAATVASSP